MNAAGQNPLDRQLDKAIIGMIVFWSVVIVGFAAWNYWRSYTATIQIARAFANESFNKDLIYRHWGASHGGVYVPITPETPPSAALADVPERDISTPSGKKLTLINPALMMRQIYEMGKKEFNSTGHITSLNPIRPENAPDEWEKLALQAFERGATEVSSIEPLKGESYYRFMRPMITEAACLKCHAKQGYKVGEIRGGVSVSVPWDSYRQGLSSDLLVHGLGYGTIWIIGLIGMLFAKTRLQQLLSERRRAEGALRLSVARFERAVDGANDGIWEWIPATGEDYLSPRWKQLLGYQAHELPNVQESFFNQIHPDDVAMAQEAVRAHFEERKPYQIELRLRCKSGEYRWFSSRGQAEWDEQGRPLRMSGSISDITESEQMKQDLAHKALEARERTKELACLYQASLIGLDPLLSLSEVFEKTVRLVPPAWLYPESTCARIVFGGRAYTTDNYAETRWKLSADIAIAGTKAGTLEVLYLAEKPELAEGPFLKEERALVEELARTLGVTIERRQAEAVLRESEFRWKFALEGAGDGLWDWDVPTGKVFFSKRWKEMLGFAADEVGNGLDEWRKRVHPDDIAQVMNALQAHLAGSAAHYASEHRVLCKDGRWKWILDRALVVSRDAGGKPLRVIGTHADISERKQAEETLRHQNAELRFADTAGVERELMMIDLKNQVNALSRQLGRAAPYDVSFVGAPPQNRP